MIIDEFLTEYDNLSKERKIKGLRTLFDTILSDIDDYDGIILEYLTSASNAEADDYFGTEGLDI